MGVGGPPEGQARCRNCGTELTGKYCHSCGQADTDPNPSIAEFVREFRDELLNWDGKLPGTLRALMLRPGFLTAEALAGRRARWLSPFRLYFAISVVFFLAGPVMERVFGYSGKTVARLQVTGDSAQQADLAILGDSATFVNSPLVRENAFVRAIGAPKAWTLATNPVLMKDIVAAAVPKAMFLLMPFFAFLTWLAWRRRGLRYPAHLVFSFHLHSAFFASMLVVNLVEPIGSLVLTIVAQAALLGYSTWYTVKACAVALGGTQSEVFGRVTVVGLLYLPAVLSALTIAVVAAINAL